MFAKYQLGEKFYALLAQIDISTSYKIAGRARGQPAQLSTPYLSLASGVTRVSAGSPSASARLT